MIYSLYKVYPKLSNIDFEVLEIAVASISRYEYIPLEMFLESINVSRKALEESLERLNRLKMLVKDPSGASRFRLTFAGLSIAALKRLASRDIVRAIGVVIGVGKESVVYIGKDSNDNYIAIKFYRVGFKSFRHFSKKRSYDAGLRGSQWLLRSIVSSEREYRIFRELSRVGVSVPQPYARELNAIVMEYIEGIELYRVRKLENPREILIDILDNLRIAYTKLGVIHTDLSAYNIMIKMSNGLGEKIYIFDWPQWIGRNESGANEYLLRDLRNLLRFFRNRFNIKDITLSRAYEYVTGRLSSVE
ncbi:MAG: RIO1 family regulatory kinase/ATPase [Sulfolobales archaeon]